VALPEPADAVVVLGGGTGERLALGLDLVRRGVAPVLVLSDGARRRDERRGAATTGRRLAGVPQPFEVLVRVPKPYSTRGEARMVAALGAERGWRRIVVATSDYHAPRTRLWFRRCAAPLGVEVVAARSRWGLRTLRSLAHEAGGFAEALLVARGC
jgi:uncharacterized SAM-binding protein YcdF (DUF218 family)